MCFVAVVLVSPYMYSLACTWDICSNNHRLIASLLTIMTCLSQIMTPAKPHSGAFQGKGNPASILYGPWMGPALSLVQARSNHTMGPYWIWQGKLGMVWSNPVVARTNAAWDQTVLANWVVSTWSPTCHSYTSLWALSGHRFFPPLDWPWWQSSEVNFHTY